jgi:hypothetical protein
VPGKLLFQQLEELVAVFLLAFGLLGIVARNISFVPFAVANDDLFLESKLPLIAT